MLKIPLLNLDQGLKMVKNKRDLKSPRRNRSLTGRPVTRTRPTTASCAGNIRVVVRVRPPNAREQGDNFINVIKVLDESTLVFDPKDDDEPFFYHGVQQRNRDIMKRANKNLHFTFDKVFSHEADNPSIFENSTKGLIQTLMNGYNCSVFVYGATGAGKTHTMLGCGTDPGITFLTMNELFRQKDELLNERQFEIGMTYLEVYNETVQDLLNPGPALHLREDGKYGVIVSGIKVHRIEESEKLFELLEQGNRNRTQHPTDANAESSRSHAVFQVYLRMKFVVSDEVRVAKLSMIDLAGSERGAATGYSGARFTEGANINKSLLALGNCINSLADGQRHVPYRDSKLTRLLKDSLGGNCQTFMIANVSPSSLSYEDTYNTLKYAMRAKKIKSNLKKNLVNCERNINHYVKMVEEQSRKIEELELQLSLAVPKQCKCKEGEGPDLQLQVLQNQLQTLYADKRDVTIRLLQLQNTQQIYQLRKQLKEESDARLSGICNDTPDKEVGHRRLGNAVNRLDRQTQNLDKDLASLNEQNKQLESSIKQFLLQAPQLQEFAKNEEIQIDCCTANIKAQHLQKVNELQTGELRMRDQLIEKFSEVLKPCFRQLRGHGHVTESLTANYQELIRHLQGIRSVTWDDETMVTDVPDQEEENDCNKTKILEESSLNSTFVQPEDKAPTVTAAKFMAKVYESPKETKEVAHVVSNTKATISARNLMAKVYKSSSLTKTKRSPHTLKENRPPVFQARPAPLFNNPRIISAQDKGKLAKLSKSRANSAVRTTTTTTTYKKT